MSVEIIFRGVCLFRQHRIDQTDGLFRMEDVWIPRGTVPADGEHEDGSKAFPHYARLIVLDAFGNIVSRHALEDTEVTVSDAFGGDCLVQESFKSIPDFSAALDLSSFPVPKGLRSGTPAAATLLVKRDSAAFAAGTASAVAVSGGSISATPMRNGPWEAPSSNGQGPATDLAAQATWRSQSPIASIRIASRDADGRPGRYVTDVVLDANHPRAFIYNYDVEWPSIAMLSGMEEEAPAIAGAEDHDFKFLYRLVAAKRQRGGGKQKLRLPAPTVKRPPSSGQLVARNPGSAGCYPARISV